MPATMTSVSSLWRAPSRMVGSSVDAVKAARTRARLVMLFDPGTVMSARGGRVSGTISSWGGYCIGRFRAGAALTPLDPVLRGEGLGVRGNHTSRAPGTNPGPRRLGRRVRDRPL